MNTPEDMRWLRETHLPKMEYRFHSALLIGNEDSPEEIHLFEEQDPLYTDDFQQWDWDYEENIFYKVSDF